MLLSSGTTKVEIDAEGDIFIMQDDAVGFDVVVLTPEEFREIAIAAGIIKD